MAPTKIKATKVTAYPSLMVKLMMASLKLGNWTDSAPAVWAPKGFVSCVAGATMWPRCTG
jgi:hypothetical protein